jgi:hypothetical protein
MHQRERHPYPWYQDDTPYLAPGEQVAQNEAANRAWLALRLATTPETWGGLLLGQPVAPTALDAPEFARQRRAGLA